MNSNRIMFLATGAICVVMMMALTACEIHKPEPILQTQDVYIPTAEAVNPPDDLKPAPVDSASIPFFLPPTDAKASSCLDVAGENKLRDLIHSRNKILGAWDAWAFGEK